MEKDNENFIITDNSIELSDKISKLLIKKEIIFSLIKNNILNISN